MRTLTVTDVTAPQATAFAELFPVLSDAKTNGGTPLVQLQGRRLVILCHPAVGLDVADPAAKLNDAAIVRHQTLPGAAPRRARVVGLLDRLCGHATVTDA